MSDFNNWNMPFKKPRLNSRPPGLRGKEIGMYYKQQHMRKKLEGKEKREYSLTFTMPPAVANSVKKNIRSIIKIAQQENITLPQLKMNYLENLEPAKTTNEEYNNKKIVEYFTDLKQQYDSKDDETDINLIQNDSKASTDKSKPYDAKCSPLEDAGDENKISEEISNSEIEKNKEMATNTLNPIDNNAIEIDKPSTSKTMFSDSRTSDLTGTASDLNFNSSEKTFGAVERLLEQRQVSTYKYGYQDIITGTFDEKLDECLTKGIEIAEVNSRNTELNKTLYDEYKNMIQNEQYLKKLEFRKKLPTYEKSEEILDAINKNQVLVISGETGCGKSTQVPQIILDDAMRNNRGAYIKILVTQPRRIAASSLAIRVASERGQNLGKSVGYAVRLESVAERSRGSIQFCTTGILLTDLEVNQGLTNFSHIILDEVHERDCHIDLAMLMLKQVLKKRKDLKVILMSATIDSDSLSVYFDDCLKMHIEGLAYPVEDVYLEDVLEITNFYLKDNSQRHMNLARNKRYGRKKFLSKLEDRDVKKSQEYMKEIGDWLRSKKYHTHSNVYKSLCNPQVEEINYDLIIELLKHICSSGPGAILIFLPGFGDISNLLKILDSKKFHPPKYQIYSLHSKLPTLEQHKIFEKPPENVRKIIIATNIAETSITIDDIVYVIDCGRHKITGLNVERNIETLDIQYISKANLRQRRGRAGRCQPGVCYHLLTSFRAERLEDRTLPELQRSNLLEAVLMIKRLRLGLATDALKNVPSPPAESSILWAVKHLQRCGALDEAEKLTALGWHMARLPVHPAAGKLVLLGALFGCLDRAASVAAVWGFKDPFLLIFGKEKEIEKCKREMAMGEPSDHIAVSEAIISWELCPSRDRRDFCYANFLSHNTLEMLYDMKKQLGNNLKSMGFLASGNVKSAWENRNSNNLSLFKAIVAASLYPNIATVRWIGLRSRRPIPNIRIAARTPEEGPVALHPSSVMSGGHGPTHGISFNRGVSCHRPGANWLVYWMKRRSTNLFILDVTLIYSLPLLFFGDFILTDNPDDPNECMLEVSSIKVRVKNETADLLYDLKNLLDHVLGSTVMSSSNYATRASSFDEQVLNTIIELITAEDEQAEYVNADLTDSDYSETDNDGSGGC